MSIEDAEEIFEKRWNLWSEEERQEFVSALDAEDSMTPLVLTLCFSHPHSVSDEFSIKLDALSPGWLEKRWLRETRPKFHPLGRFY